MTQGRVMEREPLHATKFVTMLKVVYDRFGEACNYFGFTRPNSPEGAVVVYPITDEGELIFVSQYRPLVDDEVIEFPAGLRDVQGENPLETANRELLEETGCVAERIVPLFGGNRGLTISVGLSDERLLAYFAFGAKKVAEPLANEGTKPIYVPLYKAWNWLHEQRAAGKEVDFKLFSAVCMIKEVMQSGIYPATPEVTD